MLGPDWPVDAPTPYGLSQVIGLTLRRDLTFFLLICYISIMIRLYLDNCCFNRPFDDQQQLKIKLETDSLHISAAKFLHCDYIITTDRKMLNKVVQDILIVNPIDFLQREVFYED